jgi:hypothetical protein
MRARQRYLKPKSLNVRAAYDARYISDLSDGAAISIWRDLSGNSFNATQATVALQPVYKKATLGGSASIRFDGAGDNLSHSITNNATSSMIMVLNRLSAQTGQRTVFGLGISGLTGDTVMILAKDTGLQWGTYVSTWVLANSVVPTLSPTILTMTDDASSGGSFFIRGAADGTWVGNSIGQGINHIGGYYSTSPAIDQTSNVDIGAFYITSAALSSSVRKRLEQSLGYSFKIACS